MLCCSSVTIVVVYYSVFIVAHVFDQTHNSLLTTSHQVSLSHSKKIHCFPFPALIQILFPHGHSLLLSAEHFIHYLSCDWIAVTSLAFRKLILLAFHCSGS